MLKRAVIRVAAVALGLMGAAALSGCVPSRPVFLEPVALTVVDDRFAWVQCLDAVSRSFPTPSLTSL